jgi:hypothetical protein
MLAVVVSAVLLYAGDLMRRRESYLNSAGLYAGRVRVYAERVRGFKRQAEAMRRFSEGQEGVDLEGRSLDEWRGQSEITGSYVPELQEQLDFYLRMKSRYEYAASHPWVTVPLEPPEPPNIFASLIIPGTASTDTRLEDLSRQSYLRRLSIRGGKYTDVGLAHLKRLTDLEVLNLQGPQVTDASLDHLAGMKKLRSVDLSNTKVSGAGVERLRRALPQTQITVDGDAR